MFRFVNVTVGVLCFVAKASRMRVALLGRSKPSKGPRFGAMSVVGFGIGATSDSDLGFRYVGDSNPAREVESKGSILGSMGLRSPSIGLSDRCESSALVSVRGTKGCAAGARGESTMCWDVCGPSPVEEGVESMVESAPTYVDRFARQG